MYRVKVNHGIRRRRSGIWVVATVAMITAAVASGSCFFGSATNLCESGRRCNPGQTCAANQDKCIDIGGCGDGIRSPDKGEACDDGNVTSGDGCSADCTSDESCGNGMKDTGETCDDGNQVSGDGCTANCIQESCGDGVFNPMNGEKCDTGTDTQACNGNGLCTIPRCGDGHPNMAFTPFMATAPEQCDVIDLMTMASIDTQGCNGNNNGFEGPGSCRFSMCGDGYTNTKFTPPGAMATPEKCDTGGNSQTCNGNDKMTMLPNRAWEIARSPDVVTVITIQHSNRLEQWRHWSNVIPATILRPAMETTMTMLLNRVWGIARSPDVVTVITIQRSNRLEQWRH
jgi:cysteine-rich repeat protein